MKERLTDAAIELMWENSYGSTSVDAICDRAGAKKGSFYHFFRSKSELTAAALEADWAKKRAAMDAVFSPTVPPIERFERFFDAMHDNLAARQQQCGSILGCPMMAIGSEISTQDQLIRGTIDQILDQKMHYFVSAIRDADAQGLIDAPDPEAKAKALFACYHGVLGQARVQNDLEQVREFKHIAMDILGVKHVAVEAT